MQSELKYSWIKPANIPLPYKHYTAIQWEDKKTGRRITFVVVRIPRAAQNKYFKYTELLANYILNEINPYRYTFSDKFVLTDGTPLIDLGTLRETRMLIRRFIEDTLLPAKDLYDLIFFKTLWPKLTHDFIYTLNDAATFVDEEYYETEYINNFWSNARFLFALGVGNLLISNDTQSLGEYMKSAELLKPFSFKQLAQDPARIKAFNILMDNSETHNKRHWFKYFHVTELVTMGSCELTEEIFSLTPSHVEEILNFYKNSGADYSVDVYKNLITTPVFKNRAANFYVHVTEESCFTYAVGASKKTQFNFDWLTTVEHAGRSIEDRTSFWNSFRYRDNYVYEPNIEVLALRYIFDKVGGEETARIYKCFLQANVKLAMLVKYAVIHDIYKNVPIPWFIALEAENNT